MPLLNQFEHTTISPLAQQCNAYHSYLNYATEP